MTITWHPVRAVARVARPAADSGPAVLAPARQPDHLASVHLFQLVLAEAAVIGIITALSQGVARVIVAVGGAALLLATALGRRRGRWWLHHALLARQFRRRQRLRPPATPADDRLAALQPLAPGLAIADVPMADGSQVGVARDDAGWFAIATVHSDLQDPTGHGNRLPLDAMVAALADAGQPGAVLQVVWHTSSAPSVEVDPRTAVAQSYHHLLSGFGPPAVPMDRTTWVVVRLGARALARAGAADTELATAPAVVAALIRNVLKSVRHHQGGSCRLLDAAGVVDALTRSCDLQAHRPGATLPAPEEEWTRWHSARLAHRSFWIQRWPPAYRAASLLDWIASVPAATTSVALTLTPEADELVDMRALVRVSAPAAALEQICHTVTGGAVRAGGQMFPLDGEQAPAAYASAPTGGSPR